MIFFYNRPDMILSILYMFLILIIIIKKRVHSKY